MLNGEEIREALADHGGLVNVRDIAERFQFSPSTISRLTNDAASSGFPSAIHIGGRDILWLASEVDEWMRRTESDRFGRRRNWRERRVL